MTTIRARERAARLGMSAWKAHHVPGGSPDGTPVEVRRVGFAGVDLPIAEAETWHEALDHAERFVFSA